MLDSLAAPMMLLASDAAAAGPSGDFGLFSWEAAVALVTLTALEIVLGVDNVIFLAILAGKLPEEQRARARFIGLGLAMVQRILLLLVVGWLVRLDDPIFTISGRGFSWKAIILLVGGLFLIGKATKEIHEKLEGDPTHGVTKRASASFRSVLIQIVLIDAVFSVDSILTAVGLVKHIEIMIAAVVISVAVMMLAAGAISRFVEKHPTIKMLALAILVMIGVLLVAEGLGEHFPRGYLYFAMAFSLVVEMLNIRATNVRKRKRGGGEASEG